MTEQRLRYGFLHNHHRLVRSLELDSLLPYLIADSLITTTENELIKNEATSQDSVDKLLSILHRRGTTDSSVYVRFYRILSDSEITSGQNLGNLVQRIRHDSDSEEVGSRYDYTDGVLVEGHSTALLEHKEDLVNSVSVGELLPELVARGVVSAQENDDIRGEKVPNRAASQLLGIVERRGSVAFNNFVHVLEESDTHSYLGRILSREAGGAMTNESYVEAVMKNGHVPPRPKVYLERKELAEKVRTELRKLKDGDSWVVVHGMAGFGKSVLAAEAIRDATLLRTAFPGGVSWLTVGQMNDQNGDLDKAKLLNKLQTLILRLDKSKNYRPPSVEAATDYLQEVISKQHPQYLLILDDVWTAEVAEAFSARCRVMVTSRNASVAEKVVATNKYSVSLSEGLNEDDARILLASWVTMDHTSLPSEADTIIDHCRGSPMAIGLIGAILKRSNTEKRWKEVAVRLEKKPFYNFNAALKTSIELSVESLPSNLKEYFEMLVVLDYDTLITGQALDTIWNTDSFDTEEYMRELVGYSLAQQGNPGAEDQDLLLYYIHDIVLDYLKDSTPPAKKRELHSLVVKRYSDKCNGAYPKLEDDRYVYQKLMSHIAAAGNYELLGDLMTQLHWLMSMVQHGDTNTYLANYSRYKDQLPEQFKLGAQQFELFLSGHMYVLANQPTPDDIIQLALLLPDTSEVYKQATIMTTASVGRKRSWFRWSNKWSDPEKYSLKLKLHHEGVSKCCYSQDESKVLSCASNEVKLWDSATGMVLVDFKGHKDHVTCCDLSPSGKLVVSSSEDCTVKVWDARKKTMALNFTGHRYGVQCCAFSPDETLVLSADIDSVVMIWSVPTGQVQSKWRIGVLSPAITPTERLIDFTQPPPVRTVSQESQGGGEGVEDCAFSPGGQAVVTSSQNGSIRMWNLNGTLHGVFKGHTGHVRCCVFSQDGDLLATASLDRTAKVWNVLTQECDVTISNEEAAVLSCDFSPDSSRLLTGDTEGSVKVWSLPQATLLQEYPAHWDFVNCVLYSPKSQYILSAADNGLIKIMWVTDEKEAEPELAVAATPLYHRRFSVHFRPEGSNFEPIIVAYVTKERKLQVLRGTGGEVVIPSLSVIIGLTPRCWVISSDGSLVAVGYEEGALQVFSLSESEGGEWAACEVWRMKDAHNSNVVKIYFSPKSNKFISCSDKHHKVWLAREGRGLSVCDGRGLGVRPCVFFEDSVLAVSTVKGGVLVWNTNTGSILKAFTDVIDALNDNILCVALSADNKRLAASATDGRVMVWDVSSGALLYHSDLLPLSPCARSCALSPDGSLVAAGFDDGSLRIWNVNKHKLVNYRVTESDYWMIDLAFSPAGSTIVTLCDSIEWWRTDGTHTKRVMLKGTFGKYIRFSPDFMTFVTIDNAGILYILTQT